jgi:hypothetical protein
LVRDRAASKVDQLNAQKKIEGVVGENVGVKDEHFVWGGSRVAPPSVYTSGRPSHFWNSAKPLWVIRVIFDEENIMTKHTVRGERKHTMSESDTKTIAAHGH